MTRSEQRVYRLAFALLGGAALVGSLAALAGAPGHGAQRGWSPAVTLESCAGEGSPAVAFPHDDPSHATGAGAIVWRQGAGCPGGAALRVAMLGGNGRVAREELVRDDPGADLHLTGAPGGRVLLAGAGPLREGSARERLESARGIAPAAGAWALASAYRGQAVALYALPAGSAGALLLRRAPLVGDADVDAGARAARNVASTTARVGADAVALDYRTDAVAVWEQGASVYARSLPRSAKPGPVQRLGGCGARPQIAALMSDDGRAIVVWMGHARGRTSIYAEVSAPGVRFGAPTLLESYRDPHGAAPPGSSLRLVRLSSERVLVAWPGVDAARYVVRVAHVAVSGVQAPITIAGPPGSDALLADLAPGPRADALALWTRGHALLASYGGLSAGGRPLFAAPEAVATGVAAARARVAFDPDSDRAIAVWRTTDGAIASAVRGPGAGG